VQLGPDSRLAPLVDAKPEDEHLDAINQESRDALPTLDLEAQGIMVYDRSSGGESHVRALKLISKTMLTNLTDNVDDPTMDGASRNQD
jgi:hypothetical protein